MREIKFRAIDEFSDDFIIGQAFFVDSDNRQGYISNGVDRYHCVKKETIGQFTGLKDKNGVDIYEGDIDNRNRICEYFPNLGSFGFKSKNHSAITFLGQFITSGCQIIGNIYENPELLT